MILTFMVSIFLGMIRAGLIVIPDLPSISEEIIGGTEIVINYIADAAGFVSYIFTPGLIIFILTATTLLFNFDTAYKAFMWGVSKIPWVNIH